MNFNSFSPPQRAGTTEHIATSIVRKLQDANQTLGVAESLTGGGVMSAVTSIPGSSAVFNGGVVSYATGVKKEILGVDEELIAREGVVNSEVARQMAMGARRVTSHGNSKTTWGMGTTGVAGPASQDNKPAGTVYIGIACPNRSWARGPYNFTGSRDEIRRATVKESLFLLEDAMEGYI